MARELETKRTYYVSTFFSGETILGDAYETYEEAKAHTTSVFPDVDWEEVNKYGFVVASSYGKGISGFAV